MRDRFAVISLSTRHLAFLEIRLATLLACIQSGATLIDARSQQQLRMKWSALGEFN